VILVLLILEGDSIAEAEWDTAPYPLIRDDPQ